MRRIALLALFRSGGVAFAQDEDCLCLGEWVQVQDGSPFNVYLGPIFIESIQTPACDPLTVDAHSHQTWKTAMVYESGGSCSTLNWIPELQTIFDSSHWIDVTREEYDIVGGYEAIEDLYYLEGNRLQSFDCVLDGNVEKTLFRLRHIDYNHRIEVTFNKIRECRPEPGSGWPTGIGHSMEGNSQW